LWWVWACAAGTACVGCGALVCLFVCVCVCGVLWPQLCVAGGTAARFVVFHNRNAMVVLRLRIVCGEWWGGV
jgi:hypothetical protein